MTKITPTERCPVCGEMLVIPQLATGVVLDKADYVCSGCGVCLGWSAGHEPTLKPIREPKIPQPPHQKA